MGLLAAATSMHLQRHQLVRLFPNAWQALLESRHDLASVPWIKDWADYRWPLIVRRRLPGETSGVPVGLPLPPSAGKRRIALQVRDEDIASMAPLPRVSEVIGSAPVAHVQPHEIPAFQPPPVVAVREGVPDQLRALRP